MDASRYGGVIKEDLRHNSDGNAPAKKPRSSRGNGGGTFLSPAPVGAVKEIFQAAS
jgi:hypothetical protein